MLKEIYYDSLLYHVLIKDSLHDARSGSKALNFLGSFSHSINKIFNKIELGQIIRSSLIYSVASKLFDKLHILAGLTMLLTIIVPHNNWNNIYSLFFTVALVFIYLLKQFEENPQISYRKGKADIIILLFIFQVFLSAFSSLMPRLSFKYIFFYLNAFILMGIIAKEANNIEKLSHTISLFLTGTSLAGVYGVYQRIVGVSVNASYTDMRLNEGMFGRVFSTMENPNNFGELLILALPFFIALILSEKNPRKRLLYAVMSIPVLLSLVFTGTRSAWISFAFGALIFVFLKDIRLLPVFILLGIGGFIALPFVSPAVYRRVLTIFNPNDTSVGYRRLIFNTVKPMIKDYGLFGVGLGTDVFRKICSTYFQFTKNNVVHSHNLFIQILVEMGTAGFLLFIGILYRALKGLYYIIDRSNNSSLKNIAIAGISAMLSILVMGFADYVWFYPRVLLIFWGVVGIIFAAISLEGKKSIQ